jgi:hypothetical protein
MKLFFNLAAAALLVGGGAMLTNGAIPRFNAINATYVSAPAPAPLVVDEYSQQPIWAQMIAMEYCDNIQQLAMGKEQARTKAFASIVPLYGDDMRELADAVVMTSIDKAAVSKCGRAVWS